MKEMTTVNGTRFIRIDKRAARKAYEAGKTVHAVACKMHPGGWAGLCPLTPGEETNFTDHVNSFAYYNCTWETGYYPHFYIPA